MRQVIEDDTIDKLVQICHTDSYEKLEAAVKVSTISVTACLLGSSETAVPHKMCQFQSRNLTSVNERNLLNEENFEQTHLEEG